MKVKTNVRAGAGGRCSGGGGGANGGHSSGAASTGVYVPPVSRCVGA